MSLEANINKEGLVVILWKRPGGFRGCNKLIISICDQTSRLEWIRLSTTSMESSRTFSLKIKIPPFCGSHELTVSTKAVTIVQESTLPWCFNVIAEETCQVSRTPDPSDFNSLSLDFDMMGLGSKPVEKNIVHLWRCVLNQNVGIRVKNDRMVFVIMKGTELPNRALQGFTTTEDEQSEVSFRFYQGGDECAAQNTYLFEFPLSSIRALPKHVPKLELNVSIDELGSLTASAQERNGTSNSGLHTLPSKLEVTKSSFTPVSVDVERSSVVNASVILPTRAQRPQFWLITLRRISAPGSTKLFLIRGSERRYEFPFQFMATCQYSVTINGLDKQEFTDHFDFSVTHRSSECQFRAELTLTEIGELHRRAVRHTECGRAVLCRWLYRNKPSEYFRDIDLYHDGIMEVYDKDPSGDPASPINGQIQGLFFLASVERGSTTGEPNIRSQFGDTRLLVPVENLMMQAPNLYFVDYYCMRGVNHYVTLVMTKSGSEADRYCEPRLLKLDASNNPFLFYSHTHRIWFVSAASGLIVELLYTENIDIQYFCAYLGAQIKRNILPIGKGRSTPGGLKKNPDCTQCNLNYSRGVSAYMPGNYGVQSYATF